MEVLLCLQSWGKNSWSYLKAQISPNQALLALELLESEDPKDPVMRWEQNTTAVAKHYGRVSETLGFPGEIHRKSGVIVWAK